MRSCSLTCLVPNLFHELCIPCFDCRDIQVPGWSMKSGTPPEGSDQRKRTSHCIYGHPELTITVSTASRQASSPFTKASPRRSGSDDACPRTSVSPSHLSSLKLPLPAPASSSCTAARSFSPGESTGWVSPAPCQIQTGPLL